MQFFDTRVVAVEYPTEDVLCLTLEPCAQDVTRFSYQAGQHVYVKVKVQGERLIRAYSLSSSPVCDETLQITIKKIPNGSMSQHLHQTMKVGSPLRISEPKGVFAPTIQASNHQSYYFFATGSGITPIWSMIKTILTVEPWSYVYLLYGNRDEDHMIFHDDIMQWQQRYPQRFVYEPVLSQPLSHRWSALLSTRKMWEGETGHIDAAKVSQFIHQYPPAAQRVRYLLCGVGAMMQTVRDTLLAMEVEPEDILSEHFSSPESQPDNIDAINANMTVTLNNQTHQLKLQGQQTLLSAMLEQGVNAL